MISSRLLFFSVFLLGLAVAATFHASGALSVEDARFATVVDGSIATSPPSPITSRVLSVATDVVRLVWAPTGLYRAMHLSAGILFAFAAALGAIVAARLAATQGIGAVAAAVFVAGTLLFGADFAQLGLSAHSVPVLLVLLSAAAWGWTTSPARPLLGGILLGLATAEHPLVLFALPGFGAFAIQASLRVAPGESDAVVRRSIVGFFLGFGAVLLPILHADNAGLVHASQPRGAIAALHAWAHAGNALFWSPAGPQHWVQGFRELALALWRNVGPLGLVLSLAGLATFFAGRARFARPFLVLHAFMAIAIVLGHPADKAVAAVLVSWPFLFWALPSLAAWEARLAARPNFSADRAAGVAPLAAALSVAVLFAVNARVIDRSAEKGVEWSATVLQSLPENAILVTQSPVLVSLVADGLRPDVDVINALDTSTMNAFRGGRMLLPLGETVPDKRLDPETLALLVHASQGGRHAFVDPSVYFDVPLRELLLGERWTLVPHGLAFRLDQVGQEPSPEQRRAASLAWEPIDMTPDTPASPLRDGLTGAQYFGRSLLQSAYLHLGQKRPEDAEREFLLALGHPDANANAAVMGYAQFLNLRRNYRQMDATLERYIRDDQDGAWMAHRLQANNLILLGERERARKAFQRALSLVPVPLREERARLQQSIRGLQSERRPPAARTG